MSPRNWRRVDPLAPPIRISVGPRPSCADLPWTFFFFLRGRARSRTQSSNPLANGTPPRAGSNSIRRGPALPSRRVCHANRRALKISFGIYSHTSIISARPGDRRWHNCVSPARYAGNDLGQLVSQAARLSVPESGRSDRAGFRAATRSPAYEDGGARPPTALLVAPENRGRCARSSFFRSFAPRCWREMAQGTAGNYHQPLCTGLPSAIPMRAASSSDRRALSMTRVKVGRDTEISARWPLSVSCATRPGGSRAHAETPEWLDNRRTLPAYDIVSWLRHCRSNQRRSPRPRGRPSSRRPHRPINATHSRCRRRSPPPRCASRMPLSTEACCGPAPL